MFNKNQENPLEKRSFSNKLKCLLTNEGFISKTFFLFILWCNLSINNINAQSQVIVGNGTGSGTFTPVASWYNSSATESVYLGVEIGYQGEITHLAFDKASGNSTTEVEVKIYMRSTSQINLGQSDYIINSTQIQDYQLVYEGTIPNNSTTGWMEIALDNAFSFNGATSNLAILVEGFTCISSGRPQYRYTTTSPSRMSSTFDDGSIGCDGNNPWSFVSSLRPKLERPNARFTIDGNPISTADVSNLSSANVQFAYLNGNVVVSSSSSLIAEINLFDVTGKLLYSKRPQSTSIQMETQSFNSGIFIVKAVLENGREVTQKIIL